MILATEPWIVRTPLADRGGGVDVESLRRVAEIVRSGTVVTLNSARVLYPVNCMGDARTRPYTAAGTERVRRETIA